MSQKRELELEGGQKPASELDTPIKKTLTEPKPDFPEYLEQFILNEEYIFNRLINLDFPTSVKEYVHFNPELSDYFGRLHDALWILSKTEIARRESNNSYDPKKDIIRKAKHKKTQALKNRIICDQLVNVLSKATTMEAREVIQLLHEGMESWRLPLLLNLHILALEEGKEKELQALTWIEKRRGFIQSAMNRDPKLMHWLRQTELDAVLIAFTDDMYQLLTETVDINVGRGYLRETPKIMDVRALWHTLSFHGETHGQDRDNDSQLLQNYTKEDLFLEGYFSHFTGVSASPWTCFLEMFNGPSNIPHKEDVLRVSGDVLSWLLITHPENQSIATKIIRHSASIDWVCDAYEKHLKQANSSLLAESMSRVLQAVHNSPTKTKPRVKRQLDLDKSSPEIVTELESPLKRLNAEEDAGQNLQSSNLSTPAI